MPWGRACARLRKPGQTGAADAVIATCDDLALVPGPAALRPQSETPGHRGPAAGGGRQGRFRHFVEQHAVPAAREPPGAAPRPCP